jgi:hypothetical protein
MPTVFSQSLWGDEAFSAVLSMKTVPDIIKTIIHDTSPPLWNLFEWLFFKLFGRSEIVIHSLSLIFFLIAAFFTYKIAAYLWNKKTGFLALGLTLLNPFFFIYAFEGRMYSILAAGVAASMYFFITKKWTLYVFATLFALYSHHFSIFALFVQGLWFIYEFILGDRKSAKKMFRSFVFVGIGYIPWMIPLYSQMTMIKGGFWLGKPTVNDLGGLFSDYLGTGIPHKLAIYARNLVLLIFALKIWTKDFKRTFFLVLWFTLPILITWIVSQKFTPIFFNRYLLYTIPGGMIILASNSRKYVTYLLLVVMALFAIIDLHYFINPTKIPFRDLANYVKQTQIPGDFLINEDAGSHKLWESKFYGIPAPIYDPTNIPLPYFVGTALMEKQDVINVLPKDSKRLGVITYKKGSELKFAGYKILSEKSFKDLNFVWMGKVK